MLFCQHFITLIPYFKRVVQVFAPCTHTQHDLRSFVLQEIIRTITEQTNLHVRHIGSEFTVQDLFHSSVHPAIRHFISAKIDYLIYRDRRDLLVSKSSFDYNDPALTKHFEGIDALLKQKKVLNVRNYTMIAEQAVQFTIHYLAAPNRTLSKFTFDSPEPKSTEEIRYMVKHCYYYGYLKKVLLLVLDMKKKSYWSREEFERLLVRAQQEVLQQNKRFVITNGIAAMKDFMSARDTANDELPLQLVEVFLRSKGLEEYVERLRKAFAITESAMETEERILSVIFEEAAPIYVEPLYQESPLAEESPLPAEPQSFYQPEPEQQDSGMFQNAADTFDEQYPEQADDDQVPMPVFDDIGEDSGKESTEMENPFHMPVEEELPVSPEPEIVIHGIAEPEPEPVLVDNDIFTYFNDKETEKLVQDIFYGDTNDFISSMEMMTGFRTYPEAEGQMTQFLEMAGIDPGSKTGAMVLDRLKLFYEKNR